MPFSFTVYVIVDCDGLLQTQGVPDRHGKWCRSWDDVGDPHQAGPDDHES